MGFSFGISITPCSFCEVFSVPTTLRLEEDGFFSTGGSTTFGESDVVLFFFFSAGIFIF